LRRINTRSGFDKVHIACLRPKGRSILVSLLLLLETSYFHNLPLPLLCTPRLPDFAFLGYPCCGMSQFKEIDKAVKKYSRAITCTRMAGCVYEASHPLSIHSFLSHVQNRNMRQASPPSIYASIFCMTIWLREARNLSSLCAFRVHRTG
jgi:hypothetical protein